MAELGEVIKVCSERLDRYRRPNQRIGEQNTKVMLIEPVLQALGWDLFDPEDGYDSVAWPRGDGGMWPHLQ